MKQTSTEDTLAANTAVSALPRITKRSFIDVFLSFPPIIVARFCRWYIKLTGEMDFKSSVSIDPHTSYLFVANHQSQLDPFSVFGALSIRENLKAAPVRFMTAKTVYNSPLKPFLKIMGCYPTRGSRQEIIAESVGHIRDGYNIFMFPEGKRTLQSTSEPRPGVSDLIKQASAELNIKMILVHIEWRRMSFGRRHVTISMAQAAPELFQKDATEIMNALYKV